MTFVLNIKSFLKSTKILSLQHGVLETSVCIFHWTFKAIRLLLLISSNIGLCFSYLLLKHTWFLQCFDLKSDPNWCFLIFGFIKSYSLEVIMHFLKIEKNTKILIYNIPAMHLLLSLSLDISLVHIFVAKTHQNKVNQCNNSPN